MAVCGRRQGHAQKEEACPMKRTILMLAILAVAGTVLAAAAAEVAKRSVYADATYGFTIQAPAFGKAAAVSVIPVQMFGPAEDGFASNVNVMVQNVKTTRADFKKQSAEEFKAGGLKVASEKDLTVSGKDAVQWTCEGKAMNKDLGFVVLAVIDADRVYLVTCTALKEAMPKLQNEFLACVGSFALTK
jgi:hypothetical protein